MMDFRGHLNMVKLLIAQTQEAVPATPATNGGGGEGGGGGAAPSGSPLTSMLPMFIAFIAIMYFLMIRPQQKREKERREMLGALAKGDEVVTTGGVCGTVVNLSENHVVLRVDDDVTMQFLRSAIAQVTPKEGKK